MIFPILVQSPNGKVKKIMSFKDMGSFLWEEDPQRWQRLWLANFSFPAISNLGWWVMTLAIFSFLAIDGVPARPCADWLEGWDDWIGDLSHSVIGLESGPILRSETLSCSSFSSWGPAQGCPTRRHPISVSCWMELMFPTIKWDMPHSDVSWAEEMRFESQSARIHACMLMENLGLHLLKFCLDPELRISSREARYLHRWNIRWGL